MLLQDFNPSRPDPGRREKINLNFYFHTSLWCLRKFYKGPLYPLKAPENFSGGIKAFIKPFESPQRSVKI